MPVPFGNILLWIAFCNRAAVYTYNEIIEHGQIPDEMLFAALAMLLGVELQLPEDRAKLNAVNKRQVVRFWLLITSSSRSLFLEMSNHLLCTLLGYIVCNTPEEYLSIDEYFKNVDPMLILEFVDHCQKSLSICAANAVCYFIHMRCHNNPEIVGFCEDVIDPQYVMPSPYYTASVFNRNDMCDIIHNKKKNIGARNLAMLIRQLFNTLKLDSNIYFIKMCMTNVLCIVGHSTLPVEYAQSVYEFAPNVFKVFMWSTINANTYKEVKMQKSIPIHEVVMTRPEFTKHNMDLIFNATFTNQDFVSKANIGVYTANLFKSLLPAEKTLLFDHILQHAKSPNLTRADLKRAGITRS